MQPEHRASHGRVLFVDDDPFYRDMALASLTEAGFAMSEAADGERALGVLASETFDLIVLDLAMPGVSGFDVIERIRGEPRQAALPVLVITGHDDAVSVERAFEAGATSFLVKPLNWTLFVHHVRFMLVAAAAQAELRNASRTATYMSSLKNRLVDTLVTEFHAPLRSAYGFATLLKHEADGPIGSALYKGLIDDLHVALGRLSGTHLKMLNFGRSLAAGIALNEEYLDLAQFVGTAIELARAVAERRRITLAVDLQLQPGLLLRGDRLLVSQALAAVVGNAVRLSRRNSTVSLVAALQADGSFHLTVQDSVETFTQTQIDEILGHVVTSAPASPETVESNTALKLARMLLEAHQGTLQIAVAAPGLKTTVQLPRNRLLTARPPAVADRIGQVARILRQTGALPALGLPLPDLRNASVRSR